MNITEAKRNFDRVMRGIEAEAIRHEKWLRTRTPLSFGDLVEIKDDLFTVVVEKTNGTLLVRDDGGRVREFRITDVTSHS